MVLVEFSDTESSPSSPEISTFGEYVEEIFIVIVIVTDSTYKYFMVFSSIVWLEHLHIEICIILL